MTDSESISLLNSRSKTHSENMGTNYIYFPKKGGGGEVT